MEKQERVCIGIEWRRGWGQRVVVMRDYISAQVLFLFIFSCRLNTSISWSTKRWTPSRVKGPPSPFFHPFFTSLCFIKGAALLFLIRATKKGKGVSKIIQD